MNEIVNTEFQGRGVRMVMVGGNPWWVLRDVCEVLGLQAPHMVAARLEEDERSQTSVIDSLGRSQETTIINESGLYSVILRSDKAEAKAFRRWVTAEVLPAIRKTGTYRLLEGSPARQQLLPQHEAARAAALIAIEALNPAPAGRLVILKKAYQSAGLPTDCLPSYAEEEATRSLTELLKEHGIAMTAATANKLLAERGIIERQVRKNARGSDVGFWALTKAGALYGKNLVSTQNPRETQPHYFPARFGDLLALLGIEERRPA